MASVQCHAARLWKSTRAFWKPIAAAAFAQILPCVTPAMTARTFASDVQPSSQQAVVCEREAAKLPGPKPVRVDGKIRAPKKLRHVQPAYPKPPPGTVGSGYWIGEVLIDARGKVSQVWIVREPTLTPPYPPFPEAIVDAIRQWEFEPLKIKGVPTSLCMTVVTMLHWE